MLCDIAQKMSSTTLQHMELCNFPVDSALCDTVCRVDSVLCSIALSHDSACYAAKHGAASTCNVTSRGVDLLRISLCEIETKFETILG
jgi:hypothetical protein